MEIVKFLLILIQFLLILSSILGFPGNLVSIVIPLIFLTFKFITWQIFLIIVLLILFGELVEFLIGYFSSKFFGISNRSFWLSVVLSFIFGIIMSPLFFGIGALFGVFIGAFSGTFIYEYSTTKNFGVAFKRGFLSLFSRITGCILKITIGLYTLFLNFNYGF